ncbi:MAG: CDP-alcohol phosphatidyltransferase family protein [Ignavibacteriales bacterium]|nr:CDP-alcohol phosphatidyltransferase family protein [Ignavibacteriales bacterium]
MHYCVFAATTDMLDGYLARKLNQVTEVGKIIDPLADKAAMAVIVVKLFLIGEISTFLFLYNYIKRS